MKGYLLNYEIQFNFWSKKKQGGISNVMIAPGKMVHGALYEVLPKELEILDEMDGVYKGDYLRRTVLIVGEDGKLHPAELYQVINPQGPFPPSKIGEPKKNFFKILYFSSVEFDPFVFEHFDFSLYSGSRCLSLKAPNPTGCGNNPVSGNLGRIGVSSHSLSNPPICSSFQGMGNFFIGRYAPFRHLP